MSNKKEYGRKFVRYIRRTAKNKIVALVLLGCGLATRMLTTDITALVFLSIIATLLFFSRENQVL